MYLTICICIYIYIYIGRCCSNGLLAGADSATRGLGCQRHPRRCGCEGDTWAQGVHGCRKTARRRLEGQGHLRELSEETGRLARGGRGQGGEKADAPRLGLQPSEGAAPAQGGPGGAANRRQQRRAAAYQPDLARGNPRRPRDTLHITCVYIIHIYIYASRERDR